MNKRMIGTLAVAAVWLAGCGGSDGGDVATDEANASTSAPAADDAADAAAQEDQTDDQDAETTGAESDAGDTDADGGETEAAEDEPSFEGSDSGDFCGWAVDVNERFDAIEADPFEVFTEEGMDELLAALTEAADRAPDEIQADVETTLDGFRQLRDVLAEYDYDLIAAVTENETLFDEIAENSDLEEASERVNQYIEQVCGIDTGTDDIEGADVVVTTPDIELDIDPSGSEAEIFADVLASSFGLDDEQRQCFVDNIDPEMLSGAASGEVDPMAFLDVLTECGVSLADLGGG